MSSQFFGLNIAYKGLLASNAALNTTSNNISNVQTEGYSRQQVVQQASDAIRTFQTYGCAGAGVETIAIERVRNDFYDMKYWNNNASLGEYEMKQYYTQQVENYLRDDDTTTGFKTIFDEMMTGLQEAMKNPSSTETKAQFISLAGNLTEYFNNLAGNLEQLQKDVNQEIKLKVDEMNSLASEIASLNKQINVIELSGSKANELRDRRAVLVDKLSQIVDVKVTETPIVDTNNPERETGAYRFMVTVAGGQFLVDGSEYFGLECVAKTSYEKINQTDIDGLYDVYWENGQAFNMYNASMGGALAGLIQMRDGNNAEGFEGIVTKVDRPEGANPTVEVRVSEEHLFDLNKCNLSDQGGKINLGNQIYYYDSWSYEKRVNGAGETEYYYTFTLSDSNKNDAVVTNDREGKKASIGGDVDYQGIPYYMSQMNEWVRTFAQHVNDILTSGVDVYEGKGNILFTGNMTTDNEQYDFPDDKRYDHEDGIDYPIDVTDESYYLLTAKNFTILEALVGDADLLATRKDATVGVENGAILEDIFKMAYSKDAMSFRGCSSGEFLQCVLSDVALNASRANMFKSNYKNISDTIANQRISISGVDEDEEALNLVKYQNAYNLASKMIQTLTEVYDRLILETGV